LESRKEHKFLPAVRAAQLHNFGGRGILGVRSTASNEEHLTNFAQSGRICCWHNCRGGIIFVSKTAAVVLAFLSVMLIPTASKAQLIPSGNVYAGVAYADSVDVVNVNRLAMRGWDGSVEMFPFHRFTFLGIALDGSGVYTKGIADSGTVQQYNLVLGPRVSMNIGKWRPFAHALGGIQQTRSGGTTFHPVALDFGGGVDRKLPFKNFSWRLQFDYVHTHLLSANQNEYRGSTGIVWRF
jgi:hypothetical protein